MKRINKSMHSQTDHSHHTIPTLCKSSSAYNSALERRHPSGSLRELCAQNFRGFKDTMCLWHPSIFISTFRICLGPGLHTSSNTNTSKRWRLQKLTSLRSKWSLDNPPPQSSPRFSPLQRQLVRHRIFPRLAISFRKPISHLGRRVQVHRLALHLVNHVYLLQQPHRNHLLRICSQTPQDQKHNSAPWLKSPLWFVLCLQKIRSI